MTIVPPKSSPANLPWATRPAWPGTRFVRRAAVWTALGIGLLIVYLLTSSQQYDADVLGELKAINHLDVTSPDPAHMLYVRIGVPFYRLWLTSGYPGDALRPMQVLNACFGAATITLFAVVLRRFRIPWALVLSVSAAAGLSYGFWTHTVDAFFIIPAAFFAMVALICALLLSSSSSTARLAILGLLLGIGFGLAVLSYQANLALIPALIVAGWPARDGDRPRRVKAWIVAGAVFLLLSGGAWVIQALTLAHLSSPSELLKWFLFRHGGMQEGLWRREGVNPAVTAPIAWLATVLPVYEGLRLRALVHGVLTPDRIPAQVSLVALGAIWAFALLGGVRRRSAIWATPWRKQAFLVGLLWFALPGLAVVWFDPAEVKLWLIPIFGLWMLLALLLGSLAEVSGRRLVFCSMGVAAGLVALSNFLVPVWTNHRLPSEKLATAKTAMNHLTARDLVVSATFDWTGYLGYLSDEYRVFNAIYQAQTFGTGSVKEAMLKEMAAAWDRGGHVYVVDYFGTDADRTWAQWITPFTHLTRREFDAFGRRVAWQTDAEAVWELSRRP
jgi:hypothetical protein